VRVGTCGQSPSEAHTGLIENSSVPGRMPLAMPRDWAAENPRPIMTSASTGRHWVHLQPETHGACVLPVRPPSTGGAQAPCDDWQQLRSRSACGWFRLWRTPLGVGNADAGVCVVLSCKGRKLKPEGREAGWHDAKEGDIVWSDSPHQAADRIGRLRSLRRVLLANSGELLFCAHHGRQHAKALAKVAVDIQDESNRLSEPQPQ
jgi:hypothetical protein